MSPVIPKVDGFAVKVADKVLLRNSTFLREVCIRELKLNVKPVKQGHADDGIFIIHTLKI